MEAYSGCWGLPSKHRAAHRIKIAGKAETPPANRLDARPVRRGDVLKLQWFARIRNTSIAELQRNRAMFFRKLEASWLQLFATRRIFVRWKCLQVVLGSG